MATDTDIVVSIGAGGIGEAITRRQGFGKSLLLVNISGKTLAATASALRAASYKVEARLVDVKFRNSVRALAEAALSLGHVTQIINTAGLSPNMAPVAQLLKVDLYGTAVAFEEFEKVIAPGGAGLMISSMAGHMLLALTPEQDHALAYTQADELLDLLFLKDDAVPSTLVAYMMAKRAGKLSIPG